MFQTTSPLHKNLYLIIFTLVFGLSAHAQTYLNNLHNIGKDFVTLGNNSYFFATSAQGERGLWKTDGTQNGTYLIKAIASDSYDPKNLFQYENALYFAAYDNETGVELWKSDGTSSGTYLFKDLNPSGSSSPSNFTIYKGLLYFTAVNYYYSGGTNKLYRSDGTVEGTVLAEDIIDAETYAPVAGLKVANDKLYFTRAGILYETDGTSSGTGNVVIDGLQYITGLNSFSTGLYFITRNHNSDVVRLYRLTDLNNYEMLKEFTAPNYSGIKLYELHEINNNILFVLGSGSAYKNVKDTLWKTDGTAAGTLELVSFGNGSLSDSGNFTGFVDYNGELFFNAGPATNSALWKTDGTQSGTLEVIPNAGLNSKAPMVVLENNLYFLSSLTLYSYNTATQENKKVWDLYSFRKTTADNYFIKSDGRYVYAAVNNEREEDTYTLDLFHTGANPILKVKKPWGLLNGGSLRFDTKIDSLVKTEMNIQNVGNAPLVFSKVFVSGEGFYIDGKVENDPYQPEKQTEFSQQITTYKWDRFEIGFLPQTAGTHSGYLILRSNDTSQPEFKIKLEGHASDIPAAAVNATFPTEKEIKWDTSGAKLLLDNSFISENASSGTVVGTIINSAVGESFTYQMVPGVGGEDNSVFTVNSNQVIIENGFQANNKKSYSIRIKATGSGGTLLEESFVIGVEEENLEVELGDCEKVAVSLTSDLLSVAFINDTDAIAVGGEGIVLKTYDKGNTWEQLHVIERTSKYLQQVRLYDVKFVDSNTGFILGEETLLRTDDAGLHWRPLQLNNKPVSGKLKLVALSSEVLFITMENSIFKSIDGGHTWFKTAYNGYHNILEFYFYDDNFGFASDDFESYTITRDGGLNWTNYKLEIPELGYNEDITSVFFSSPNMGFAATNGGKVLKSTDGGLSWELVNSEYRGAVNEIYFIDNNNGYMIGGSAYETSDGGFTWNIVSLSTCSDMNDIAFNDLGDLIAVGKGCYDGHGRTIYNAPTGSPWTEVSGIFGTREIRNIIIDEQEAYLFSSSQSRKSIDGGITWKKMITPIDGQVETAQKIGNAILIKSYSRIFYKSIDGGLSWTQLNGGMAYGGYDILNENTIFAGTMEGGMAKSTDAGETWTIISGESPDYKNAVEFIDENVGFAVGHSVLFKTQDGGVSWQEVTVDPANTPFMNNIIFASSRVGILSTNDGLYKTIDGGDTWTLLPLKGLALYTNQIIPVTELLWYVGSGKSVFRTQDGGVTWETYYKGSHGMYDMDIENNVIYISDSNGEVYKVVDDLQPLDAGYINGDRTVRVGDQEIYTVVKQSDNSYAWSVTGNNDLVFEDNFARVTWETPGEYILEVTPYATCKTGTPSQIIVKVYAQVTRPEINGPLEVYENNNGIVYTTPLDEQASYIWSVTGRPSFQVAGNILTVDWGAMGLHQIGLIKTDLLSGIRTYNNIEVNVLPKDPFTILQTNASCIETANGRINISSRVTGTSYKAILSSVGVALNKEFTNETLFENLKAGTYDLCIKEINTEKQYCYQFTITEPEPFEVSSKMGSVSSKEVTLKFNGGIPPYTVYLNSRQIGETSQSTFKLKAVSGDILEVISSSECSFSYLEEIYFSGEVTVSPNPVVDSFTAILGKEFKDDEQDVSVRIFTIGGQLAAKFITRLSNNSIRCDVAILPSGIYVVKVGDDELTSFKIIKK